MKTLLRMLLIFVFSTPLYAAEPNATKPLTTNPSATNQWEITPAPEGSGARWMTTVIDDQGDKLNFWRRIVHIKFEAIAEFELAKGRLPKNAKIEYKIDNGQSVSLDIIEQKGNRVLWRVWSSTTNEISENDALWYMAKGNQLEISWKNKDGNRQQRTFSLTGSHKALSRIISGSYQ